MNNENGRELIKISTDSYKLPDLPADNILYHYCSLETFTKIIDSKYLYMSHYEYMNDYLDMQWIYHMIDNELKKFTDKVKVEQFVKNFNLNISDKYIVCFSEKGNILSQWRAYGNDGQGVSIGFDMSLLNIEEL
jgi:hypothetical protein